MPNVRRLLVRKGTSYTNALSPHPVCCPARAELLTGQYGQNNGVQNNKGRWGGYQAARPAPQHGRCLAAEGRLPDLAPRQVPERLPARGAHPRNRAGPAGTPRSAASYSYDGWTQFVDGDEFQGEYIAHVIRRRSNSTFASFLRSGGPFFTVINHVAPHARSAPRHLVASPLERKYRDAYPRPAAAVVRRPGLPGEECRRPAARPPAPADPDPSAHPPHPRPRPRAALCRRRRGRTLGRLRETGELATPTSCSPPTTASRSASTVSTARTCRSTSPSTSPWSSAGPGSRRAQPSASRSPSWTSPRRSWTGRAGSLPAGRSTGSAARDRRPAPARHDPGADRRLGRRQSRRVEVPGRHHPPLPVRGPRRGPDRGRPVRPAARPVRDRQPVRPAALCRGSGRSCCAGPVALAECSGQADCNREFGALPEPD